MSRIEERIRSAFLEVIRSIGNVDYSEKMNLKMPRPYMGWVDFYYDKNHYCTMFDLENDLGVRLAKKFRKSSGDGEIYDFQPTPSFKVKGRLVSEGQINKVKWAILNPNQQIFHERIPDVMVVP